MLLVCVVFVSTSRWWFPFSSQCRHGSLLNLLNRVLELCGFFLQTKRDIFGPSRLQSKIGERFNFARMFVDLSLIEFANALNVRVPRKAFGIVQNEWKRGFFWPNSQDNGTLQMCPSRKDCGSVLNDIIDSKGFSLLASLWIRIKTPTARGGIVAAAAAKVVLFVVLNFV
jgi:hypothetical protein